VKAATTVTTPVEAKTPSPTVRLAAGGVPEEMKGYRSWVCWRYERRDGKHTKVPYDARSAKRASSTDMRTWASFDEAVATYERVGYDGVGFVLSSGDPYAMVDLDQCRNPETGEIEGWAREIVGDADGYAEVSPSGTGVHVLVRGKAPNRKRGRVEAYSDRRFVTVTGRAL
jgi:primase-polymerase (primpol)-like protein